MYKIRKYRDARGRIPIDDWLQGLRDCRARQRILLRIRRLSLGLEGDWKPVGQGVRELRISEGKGYRLYYGWVDRTVVILLCGGDKSTQGRDVERAIEYWSDCNGQA